uniref:Uncharacterized protein n=1 Tax=Arion vulgaris TaxID=1028688 RepID=A0A0B7AS23_9EUPU
MIHLFENFSVYTFISYLAMMKGVFTNKVMYIISFQLPYGMAVVMVTVNAV